ncbi:MAG: cytochrome c, partial [Melioribacteraceae bacterium]|nr:cytochrome c [Melioribacteraceae bacterium]
ESEVDFKSMLKNPTRLFGLVYIYFFVIALAIGLYYLDVMNSTAFNTVPGTSLDTLKIVREIETKVGGIKPSMDLTLITNPTADFIASGKKQYETACASCHGNEGNGDGVAAVALNPKPRNFHSADGWTNGRTFYDIYKTVNDGVPGTGMTAYEFLSPEDRVAIIQYIRTMTDYPEVTIADNNKLDETYKLAAGVVDTNNISIAKSITLISDENQNVVDLADSLAAQVTNDNGANAVLLKNNVQNIEKVVYTYISKLNKKNFGSFVQILNNDPVALGYKSSVVNLLDKDLRAIYTYLKQISG